MYSIEYSFYVFPNAVDAEVMFVEYRLLYRCISVIINRNIYCVFYVTHDVIVFVCH